MWYTIDDYLRDQSERGLDRGIALSTWVREQAGGGRNFTIKVTLRLGSELARRRDVEWIEGHPYTRDLPDVTALEVLSGSTRLSPTQAEKMASRADSDYLRKRLIGYLINHASEAKWVGAWRCLAAVDSSKIRRLVADVCTSQTVLRSMTSDGVSAVRAGVANNDNIPSELAVEWFKRDRSPRVRAIALGREALDGRRDVYYGVALPRLWLDPEMSDGKRHAGVHVGRFFICGTHVDAMYFGGLGVARPACQVYAEEWHGRFGPERLKQTAQSNLFRGVVARRMANIDAERDLESAA